MSENKFNYSHNCTLVIPGLFSPPSGDYGIDCGDKLQLNELELFLTRAKKQTHAVVGFEGVLFELFNQTPAAQTYPVAPVCYLADTNDRSTGWCLRADPVQLTPDRDDLVLSGPEGLSLSISEAEHLVTELNVLFEEDRWRLEARTATRWYLHLSEDPQITTSDLSRVRGQSIGPYMPGGVEGKKWHRIMNEVQMVLHASSVNNERRNHGQLPVSSLWFWGGGVLPEFGHSDWSQVWSDEVLSLGLAKVTRTPCLSVPNDSNAWLSQINTPGEHLIVYDKHSLQQDDPEAWCKALQEFENEWLIPLLEALRESELDQLTLNACDGRTFSLTKSRLRHWWRRRKSIRFYCS